MNTHRVVRAFNGERPFKPGEEVDAAGWRNVEKLVANRFLAPLPVQVVQVVQQVAPQDDPPPPEQPPVTNPKPGQEKAKK